MVYIVGQLLEAYTNAGLQIVANLSSLQIIVKQAAGVTFFGRPADLGDGSPVIQGTWIDLIFLARCAVRRGSLLVRLVCGCRLEEAFHEGRRDPSADEVLFPQDLLL